MISLSTLYELNMFLQTLKGRCSGYLLENLNSCKVIFIILKTFQANGQWFEQITENFMASLLAHSGHGFISLNMSNIAKGCCISLASIEMLLCVRSGYSHT